MPSVGRLAYASPVVGAGGALLAQAFFGEEAIIAGCISGVALLWLSALFDLIARARWFRQPRGPWPKEEDL